MPLAFAQVEEELEIMHLRGSIENKNHLQNLGFVEGAKITIVVKNPGNLICNIKGSRIAITTDMAMRIFVK